MSTAKKPATNIYFAGPLFSHAERAWNAAVADRLRRLLPHIAIVLPQEFDHEAGADFADIFRTCIAGIAAADIVIAVIDGRHPDSGTCMELGYARALGKPTIGLCTEPHSSRLDRAQVLVRSGCTSFLPCADEATPDQLAAELVRRITDQQTDHAAPV